MTMTETQIQVLPPVEFHGRYLELVGYKGEPYVPMKPFVEAMGLTWAPQLRKLTDESDRWSTTMLMLVQTGDGKRREVTCIPLSRLPAWMSTLQISRIRNPKALEIVKMFQAESDAVLWNHWKQGSARPMVEPLSIPKAPPITQAELSLRLAITLVDHEKLLKEQGEQILQLQNWKTNLITNTDNNFNIVEERINELDTKVDSVDKKVDIAENRLLTIRTNLVRLDEDDDTPQRLTDRQKVIIIVENWVNGTTAGTPDDYRKTWVDLYNEYNKRERIILSVQSAKHGLKTLDFIEKHGKSYVLLDLARRKYANTLIKCLS